MKEMMRMMIRAVLDINMFKVKRLEG